jgi:hypothetical protein
MITNVLYASMIQDYCLSPALACTEYISVLALRRTLHPSTDGGMFSKIYRFLHFLMHQAIKYHNLHCTWVVDLPLESMNCPLRT